MLRSASTTELRPAIISVEPDFLRLPPGREVGRRSEGFLYALWLGRSEALGVGPLPSRPRRRWPPEPTWGPFFDPERRTAPRRELLPAIASGSLLNDTASTEKEAIDFSGQKLVPVLVDGGHVVSDSWQIACYLEDAYADRPSLFGGPAGRALSLFANSWADSTLVPTLARLLLPSIHGLIHEKDKDYFRATREKRFGRLEDLPAGYEAQIAALRAALLPLRQTLARQPYLAGERPAYADYAVFGMFMWARCTSALDLLAAMSRHSDISVGCYCEDEAHCHRKALRELHIRLREQPKAE